MIWIESSKQMIFNSVTISAMSDHFMHDVSMGTNSQKHVIQQFILN